MESRILQPQTLDQAAVLRQVCPGLHHSDELSGVGAYLRASGLQAHIHVSDGMDMNLRIRAVDTTGECPRLRRSATDEWTRKLRSHKRRCSYDAGDGDCCCCWVAWCSTAQGFHGY